MGCEMARATGGFALGVARSAGACRTGKGKDGGSVIFTAKAPAIAAPTTRRPTCSGFISHYSRRYTEAVSFPHNLTIGNVTISPATVLAPMAGVTDTVFRRFIRNLSGCGLIMTEFTSSHGVSAALKNGNKPNRTLRRYLAFDPEEHPISAQLFGADPDVMADAARVCEDLGFDILDINFGCPVNKVVKCNGGSGLLRDLPLVERLLTTVRRAISIPFTCKFRAGWSD
ncbi:MAG TPA: tRNA-dihydrouridine synthase family protein, partial [Urbifossiella sp.]